jgi:hypothetical protein
MTGVLKNLPLMKKKKKPDNFKKEEARLIHREHWMVHYKALNKY